MGAADPNLLTGQARGRTSVSPAAGMSFRSAAPADPTGKLAMGCQTLLLLPSAAYGTASALNPSVFSTQYVNSLAVDINVTAVATGGTAPNFQFFLERQGNNSLWYPILNTPAGPAPPTSFSIDVGNFSIIYGGINTAQHADLSSAARIRWVFGGSPPPPSYTFSVSVIGR